ncbi:MAG: NAD(P)-dependent alcohol dehydrogenase [Sphingopyxis sp.]|uniref:NAD(P)-dependent alcohol dehydrogenase n=1 Tax=Sphingopyxis sp. TaxID=1908224 RepID=UPI003D6D7597
MDVQAAVISAPGADFAIDTLTIGEPQADEVLVEIAGVGLCHTDLVFRDGFAPVPFPMVFGHEGAGIVRATGSAVTSVAPGDAVIIGFSSCGHCARCDENLPSYCRSFPALNYAGARPDGSTALAKDGQPVASHFFGQSSFASHALTPARNVVKIDPAGLDLATLGPLACGLQTGAGAVMRSLDCGAGSTIVIFGAGPVGLAGVMAAKIRDCARIIVVEPMASRRDLAVELGATDVLDPGTGDVAEAIRALLPEGVDFGLETSGRDTAIAAGLAALGSRGMLGLVGVPPRPEDMLSVNIAAMITFGHRVIGIIEGDSDQQGFIPELIALHREGRFPFDRLITIFPLAAINEAIAAQHRGECVKAVLIP